MPSEVVDEVWCEHVKRAASWHRVESNLLRFPPDGLRLPVPLHDVQFGFCIAVIRVPHRS